LNPRLIPLIAHDRAGFGGGVFNVGFLVLACTWCGTPSRHLWQALAVAGAVGFIVLGALTVRHLWTSLRPAGEHLAVRHALWLNFLVGAAALGLRHLLVDRLAPRPLLAVGLAGGALAFGGYLLILRRLRVRWVGEIEQRLRPQARAR
jgi:hypothetical protein